MTSCFDGTTTSCQFQCHCADDSDCVSERSMDSGTCPSGCKSVDENIKQTFGDTWGGPGCQVGNYIPRYTIHIGNFLSDQDFFDGEKTSDGLSYNEECVYLFDIKPGYFRFLILIDFEVKIVVYNYSFAITNGSDSLLYTYVHDSDVSTTFSVSDGIYTIQTDRIITDHLTIMAIGADFFVCDLSVVGYKYVECEEYNGAFYYGPGCLLKCKNCDVQCDMVWGNCSVCTDTSTGPDCENCISGYWGDECEGVCNCKDEICSEETGACPLTGCAEDYMGIACNILIPNLNHTTPIVKYNGSDIIISLVQLEHINDNTSLIVEYKTTNTEWTHYTRKYNKLQMEKGSVLSIPEDNDFIYLRIVPYDLNNGVLGKPSNYVHIYIFLKHRSEHLNVTMESNKPNTAIDKTIWIIITLIVFALSSILTAIVVISICKRKLNKLQQADDKSTKEDASGYTTLKVPQNTERNKASASGTRSNGQQADDTSIKIDASGYTTLKVSQNTERNKASASGTRSNEQQADNTSIKEDEYENIIIESTQNSEYNH